LGPRAKAPLTPRHDAPGNVGDSLPRAVDRAAEVTAAINRLTEEVAKLNANVERALPLIESIEQDVKRTMPVIDSLQSLRPSKRRAARASDNP
jgi:hypothetical protein